jgi:hydrogenase expression/formation protein HypC
MCIAMPVRVAALLGEHWVETEVDGVARRVSTAFIEDVALGDYLIVDRGFAVRCLDAEEAAESLALFAEIQTQMRRAAGA